MGGITPSRRTGSGDWHRRAIVRFVQEFAYREGHPPSLREIAGEVGLAISTVSYHLSVLEQDRTLRHGRGGPARSSSPLTAAREAAPK